MAETRASKIPSSQSIIDRVMSAEMDLEETECRLRYLICSSPRTGSTLLTSALQSSFRAGVPEEYFDSRYIKAFLQRVGQRRIEFKSYMEFLERKRTTPNGVFGMKVHLGPLLSVVEGKSGLYKFVSRFDRIILLTRRNVVAQAISMLKAAQTDVFNTEDARIAEYARENAGDYSALRIANYVARFIEEQAGWNICLRELQHDYISLHYEDLIADYTGHMQRIASYLGIGELPAQSLQKTPLLRLADRTSEEWEARFVGEICGAQN